MKISEVFTCPQCGEHTIEEIMTDVTVASEVQAIHEDGWIEYGEQTNVEGEVVDRFQCGSCGKTIAKDHEKLLEFLRTPKA